MSRGSSFYVARPRPHLAATAIGANFGITEDEVNGILNQIRWKESGKPAQWAYDYGIAKIVDRSDYAVVFDAWKTDYVLAAVSLSRQDPSGPHNVLGISPAALGFSPPDMTRHYEHEAILSSTREVTPEDLWRDLTEWSTTLGWDLNQLCRAGTIVYDREGGLWYHKQHLCEIRTHYLRHRQRQRKSHSE